MVRRTHYLNLIRPFIGTDVIKVITGIRRCGKSVLLEPNPIAQSNHTIPYSLSRNCGR